MNKVADWLTDRLFRALNFFGNIQRRPSDDELTAHYKQLQRSCVLATPLPLAVFVVAFIAAELLDRLEASLWRGVALTELRTLAFNVVMAGFVASILYAVVCYWRLWRFMRDEGMA
jgi:hypothetical protein